MFLQGGSRYVDFDSILWRNKASLCANDATSEMFQTQYSTGITGDFSDGDLNDSIANLIPTFGRNIYMYRHGHDIAAS
jgi:hypothetical protein